MFCSPSLVKGGFITRKKIQEAKKRLKKPYTHDRLVASLSFGFWTELFNRIQFRVGGKSLHKIFINRPVGTNQLIIYKDLVNLRDLRNRIAHHEPLCFGIDNTININYTLSMYRKMIEMTKWLGFHPDELYNSLDRTAFVSFKIRTLAWLNIRGLNKEKVKKA